MKCNGTAAEDDPNRRETTAVPERIHRPASDQPIPQNASLRRKSVFRPKIRFNDRPNVRFIRVLRQIPSQHRSSVPRDFLRTEIRKHPTIRSAAISRYMAACDTTKVPATFRSPGLLCSARRAEIFFPGGKTARKEAFAVRQTIPPLRPPPSWRYRRSPHRRPPPDARRVSRPTRAPQPKAPWCR